MTDSELERYIGLYRKNVCAAALCYVRNPSDADDIVQEVFLTLYTYEGSFESDEHVKAWLIRCAVNRSKNLLRSHWYRFSAPLPPGYEAAPDKENESDSPDIIPLLMKLGKNNRITLYMHYFEGYSVEEIAKILGINVSAVTSRLLRGRKQLEKLIDEERRQRQ